MHYVYLLQDKNKHFYIGCTKDLRKRFAEHNSGKSNYTRGKKWHLIYYESYLSKYDAFEREKKLKNFSQSFAHLRNRLKDSLLIAKISEG
jgi:putative endonuclease